MPITKGGDYRRMKRFKRSSNFQPIARAMVVVSAVVVLATGVTFAALQSQRAILTGNSIQTASADLKIGTTATSFGATRTGFSFSGLVPGGAAVPADGNTFYLKNGGTANLALKVTTNAPPTNLGEVNLDKVYILVSRTDLATPSTPQKLSLSSLVGSPATGGLVLTDTLAGTTVGQYKIQAVMDEDAFSGQSAEIGGIDLVFSGSSVIPPVVPQQ